MLKIYKYRIYPNSEQCSKIEQTFGCCRFVYNLALETKIEAYKRGVKLSVFDIGYQLTELKKDLAWLKEVDSQSLYASIKRIDSAYKSFFRGGGFPKFKKKKSRQSFQCPNNTRKINFEKRLLTIPKIQDIPIAISHEFTGKIKTVTISKTPTGKYFAIVLVDNSIVFPEKQPIEPLKTIGIDLGLKDFLITDTGIKVANPKYLRQNIERLKVLQRRASKKKKGSVNQKKANLRVAIQHERITNKRNDFLQKLSTQLVCNSQATTFCVEGLAVKNLVKNHKLAQAISDVSWSKFVEMLKYKCEWNGKNLIQIGKFEPSSKTCSNCGELNNELTLSHREWKCAKCNVTHDRDINAAINIKFMGLKTTGMGSPEAPLEQRTVVWAKKKELLLNKPLNRVC